MGRFGFIVAVIATLLGAAPARAQGGEPVGVWLTQAGDARVRVSKCGGGICGVIVWLRDRPRHRQTRGRQQEPESVAGNAADDPGCRYFPACVSRGRTNGPARSTTPTMAASMRAASRYRDRIASMSKAVSARCAAAKPGRGRRTERLIFPSSRGTNQAAIAFNAVAAEA
jgi:hypothetical protein